VILLVSVVVLVLLSIMRRRGGLVTVIVGIRIAVGSGRVIVSSSGGGASRRRRGALMVSSKSGNGAFSASVELLSLFRLHWNLRARDVESDFSAGSTSRDVEIVQVNTDVALLHDAFGQGLVVALRFRPDNLSVHCQFDEESLSVRIESEVQANWTGFGSPFGAAVANILGAVASLSWSNRKFTYWKLSFGANVLLQRTHTSSQSSGNIIGGHEGANCQYNHEDRSHSFSIFQDSNVVLETKPEQRKE